MFLLFCGSVFIHDYSKSNWENSRSGCVSSLKRKLHKSKRWRWEVDCKKWSQGIHCPFDGGCCVAVHSAASFISLNSNIKTVQVSLSPPLRQLLASHHKCSTDYTSNQCLDQGPFSDTIFHQYAYFGLDPTPPSSTAPLHLFRDSFFFFHSYVTWYAGRAYIAFLYRNLFPKFFFSSQVACIPAPLFSTLKVTLKAAERSVEMHY